jgi:hypothetical protein
MADEEKIVTRKDLISILQRWQKGKLDSRAVQDWARERFCAFGWEPEDEVSSAVLDILDGLEANLMTAEDAPVFEKSLTIKATTEKALDMLDQHINAIDNKKRRKSLENDEFYGPYIQDSRKEAGEE